MGARAIPIVLALLAVAWSGTGSGEEKRLRDGTGKVRLVRVGGVSFLMVRIPAGEARMGSREGWPDERPVHPVRIRRPFWMGKTEVSQALWKAVTGANPSAFPRGGDHPVERVSWDDCQAFLLALKRGTGIPFRLPSEAEWEYACRAGTRAESPPRLDEVAWTERNSGGTTHKVGGKAANAFGLHDMLGNVWEWCQDWYGGEYYRISPPDDPPGPVSGIHRVDRGGSWAHNPDCARPAKRDGSGPAYRSYMIGLRLAADALEPAAGSGR